MEEIRMILRGLILSVAGCLALAFGYLTFSTKDLMSVPYMFGGIISIATFFHFAYDMGYEYGKEK